MDKDFMLAPLQVRDDQIQSDAQSLPKLKFTLPSLDNLLNNIELSPIPQSNFQYRSKEERLLSVHNLSAAPYSRSLENAKTMFSSKIEKFESLHTFESSSPSSRLTQKIFTFGEHQPVIPFLTILKDSQSPTKQTDYPFKSLFPLRERSKLLEESVKGHKSEKSMPSMKALKWKIIEQLSSRPSCSDEISRFALLDEPNPLQRKSYASENRCLLPNPLIVCLRKFSDQDAKPPSSPISGFVNVKLVDGEGFDLPPNRASILENVGCGLTQQIDESSSSCFSLKIVDTSEGQTLRLLFTVNYKMRDSTGTKDYEEKILSNPFIVYSNKHNRSKKRKSEKIDFDNKSPTK